MIVVSGPGGWSAAGSGVVIKTGKDASYVLSCCHLFSSQYPAASYRIRVRAPYDVPAPARNVGVRLVSRSEKLDLSLIYLPVGPLPYVAPVAPTGHQVGPKLLSVGYDHPSSGFPRGGKLGAVETTVHVVRDDGTITTTREPPFPGRSGGPLLDGARTVGICSYRGKYNRWGPFDHGGFVSLSAIHTFLGWRRAPRVVEQIVPGNVLGNSCPGGICPLPGR